MAFTVRDFHDLIRLLEEHPEWQAELRRLLLTDDLLNLPALVHELLQSHQQAHERLARLEASVAELVETTRQLVETSRQHEERLTRLETSVAELVETTRQLVETSQRHEEQLARLAEISQRHEEQLARLAEISQRHEERLTRLEETVAELVQTTRQLVEITKRHEEQLARLVEISQRHEEQLAGLTQKMDRLDKRVSVLEKKMERVEGFTWERHYRDHAAGFFGRLVRRIRVLSSQAVDKLLEEPLERGEITWDERDDVLESDVILRGRRREDGAEVYLVAEVSVGVGHKDVERAERRAKILMRALKCPVIAAVAGERIASKEVAEYARSAGVWQVLDGRIVKPDKPLEEM